MNTRAQNIPQDSWKQMAGTAAAELIEEGMVVGLGSGSTAAYFIRALAQRIQAGLSIVGAVATSTAAAELASSLGIPLTDLDVHPTLDIDIDGADEIDPQLNLVKGAGGAMLREKVVAYASRRFVIIADETKLVSQLASVCHCRLRSFPSRKLPCDCAWKRWGQRQNCAHSAATLSYRQRQLILDCSFSNAIAAPDELEAQIRAIAGVVATGLFIGITEQAIIGGPSGVRSIGPT